jgi:hypothetical protein
MPQKTAARLTWRSRRGLRQARARRLSPLRIISLSGITVDLRRPHFRSAPRFDGPRRRRDYARLRSLARRRGSATATRRCGPGTPLRRWTPRSARRKPEPATRSRTVVEARTSPGRAVAAMRAATWTEIPAKLSPMISHSPVCTPARSERSHRVADCTSRAQRCGRCLEPREHAVADGLHDVAGELCDLRPRHPVESIEQGAPAGVAERHGPFGRANDVDEQ